MSATPASANHPATHHLQPGQPWPLGARVVDGGVNLAVWAPDATRIDWCVFDSAGGLEIARWPLPAFSHGVWHGFMPGARAGLVYGLRAHGPWAPAQGHRFNPAKLLLDPYAREVVGAYDLVTAGDLDRFRGDSSSDPTQPDPQDNGEIAMKARVLDPAWLDRRNDHSDDHRNDHSDGRPPPPQVPWSDTVLYEVHVKGATQRHPQVPAALRGRYAGLGHPAFIAHLQQLGVTSLSLLPVHARADEARLQALGLSNYWGYSSIGFFAPEPCYASAPQQANAEFKTMVDALHSAGIEVLLDVVFNHTAETDALGPTLSFRGLANARYYRLQPDDPAQYINWAGCGNVLNLGEPRVVQLVLDSLRHWVEVMGVDGFRFDLAPILGRDGTGQFSRSAGFFAALQADPVLARAKLIAEPWDLGPGGYQLGAFPAGWAEWNDRFRDTLRAFWLRGGADRGELVHRWAASSAEFNHSARGPSASVNFITAHDGFTLRDLLSFDHKHNLANGEHGRDGHHHNSSWNCGVEGPCDDPTVEALRRRLGRALLGCLLLAQGTPMLLAGDELGHSQGGNNNAYCQDNETTWLCWPDGQGAPDGTDLAADLTATVARLLRLRRQHPLLRPTHWLHGQGDVQWLDPHGRPLSGPEWADSSARALAIWLGSGTSADSSTGALLLINAGAEPVCFDLPAGPWWPAFASHCWGGDPQVNDPSAGQPGDDTSPWLGRHWVPAHSLQVALPMPPSTANPASVSNATDRSP